MYNIFKGALYVNGSGNSLLTQITFEFDSMKFLLESGDFYQAPYNNIVIGLGGYENRLVEVKALGSNNESLVCYIDEDCKDAFLETCKQSSYSINRFEIEKVIDKDKSARFFQFMVDWGLYLLGFLSVAIYFLITLL